MSRRAARLADIVNRAFTLGGLAGGWVALGFIAALYLRLALGRL